MSDSAQPSGGRVGEGTAPEYGESSRPAQEFMEDVLRNPTAYRAPRRAELPSSEERTRTQTEQASLQQATRNSGSAMTTLVSEGSQPLPETRPDAMEPREQGHRKKQNMAPLVRAYLKERHGINIPYQEEGKRINSVQDILEKAKQLQPDGRLDYLTEESVKRKARARQAAKEMSEGYRGDGVQPGNDEAPRPLRTGTFTDSLGNTRTYEKSREYVQRSYNNAKDMRKYLKERHGVEVPSREKGQRYYNVPQVLRRAQQLKPDLEELKDLTPKTALEELKAWQAAKEKPEDHVHDGAQLSENEDMMEEDE